MVKSLDPDYIGPGFESRLLHISSANLRIYIAMSRKWKNRALMPFYALFFAFFNIDISIETSDLSSIYYRCTIFDVSYQPFVHRRLFFFFFFFFFFFKEGSTPCLGAQAHVWPKRRPRGVGFWVGGWVRGPKGPAHFNENWTK